MELNTWDRDERLFHFKLCEEASPTPWFSPLGAPPAAGAEPLPLPQPPGDRQTFCIPRQPHKEFAIPHSKLVSIKYSLEIFHKALHIKLYLIGAVTDDFLIKQPGMR